MRLVLFVCEIGCEKIKKLTSSKNKKKPKNKKLKSTCQFKSPYPPFSKGVNKRGDVDESMKIMRLARCVREIGCKKIKKLTSWRVCELTCI